LRVEQADRRGGGRPDELEAHSWHAVARLPGLHSPRVAVNRVVMFYSKRIGRRDSNPPIHMLRYVWLSQAIDNTR
jgi:hypothetical protein